MRSEPLTRLADFDLGLLRIRPARRMIEGPTGSVGVEPLVMQLLIELSRNAGRVVTRREIFDRCWGSAPVGDDSLNRIVAALRRALDNAGPGLATIETVPRTGYLLRLQSAAAYLLSGTNQRSISSQAIQEGLASIRLGLPHPDMLRLESLRHAVAVDRENAAAWGILALLCRYAAEYADPVDASAYLAECEVSAARALAIDPAQAEARVALATVAPLFGRWLEARTRLCEILRDQPHAFTAAHELAIVEMATGRLATAMSAILSLLAKDPLAACLCYKSIYHHWSAGDLPGMDQLADRAIQLWPAHPAVWIARLWTLAYTGRVQAASKMLDDDVVRPPIPPPALQFLRSVLTAVELDSPSSIEGAAALSRQVSQVGPAQAISAIFALGLLDRPDEQFEVAMSYYVREGPAPVPIRHMRQEPSINDQHRRVTQILFTPACAALRSRPQFMTLCDRMGLSAYWERSGLEPDFLRG